MTPNSRGWLRILVFVCIILFCIYGVSGLTVDRFGFLDRRIDSEALQIPPDQLNITLIYDDPVIKPQNTQNITGSDTIILFDVTTRRRL